MIEEHQRVLDSICSRDDVVAAIVFDSVVQGNAKPLSDLDVAILVKPALSSSAKLEILSHGSEQLDLSIFDDLPLSLQHKVLSEGKVYMSKIDLSSLKISIMNQWFDFRPMLNRIYTKRGLLPIQ